MRRVARYTAGLVLLLALILVIGAIVLRPQFRVVGIQDYAGLVPGQPVPPQTDLTCLWHYYSYSDYFYCHLRYDRRVLIGYHQTEDTIENLWIDLPNMTIGDLILAWGEPCGVSGGYSYQYIHFAGGRSAFVGSPTTPASRVYFVKFADPTRVGAIKQWKGWQSATSRN